MSGRLARGALAAVVVVGAAAAGLAPWGDAVEALPRPDPMLGHFERPMPAYPAAAPGPIGNKIRVDGRPLRLAQFVTGDAPEQVLLHYGRTWRERKVETLGIPVEGGGSLSAFDLEAGLHQLVVAIRRGQETEVFLAETRHGASASTAKPEIPLPAGAWGATAAVTDEPGAHMETLSFLSTSGSEPLTRHYREVMGAREWREEGNLRFQKEGVGEVQVLIAPLAGGVSSVTVVTVRRS
jgi:hypothetical protein